MFPDGHGRWEYCASEEENETETSFYIFGNGGKCNESSELGHCSHRKRIYGNGKIHKSSDQEGEAKNPSDETADDKTMSEWVVRGEATFDQEGERSERRDDEVRKQSSLDEVASDCHFIPPLAEAAGRDDMFGKELDLDRDHFHSRSRL